MFIKKVESKNLVLFFVLFFHLIVRQNKQLKVMERRNKQLNAYTRLMHHMLGICMSLPLTDLHSENQDLLCLSLDGMNAYTD